jgi:hypothetical protein
VDIEPERKPRRTRRGSLVAPEEPGEQISADEFQELVKDLDIDGREQPAKRTPARAARRRRVPARSDGDGTATVERAPEPAAPERDPATPQHEPATPQRDPAADLTPEELVLKEQPKRREKRRRPRNRRHGRSR